MGLATCGEKALVLICPEEGTVLLTPTRSAYKQCQAQAVLLSLTQNLGAFSTLWNSGSCAEPRVWIVEEHY